MVIKTKLVILFYGGLWCCQLTHAQEKNNLLQPKKYRQHTGGTALQRSPSGYRALLQTWCNGLLFLQVNGGPDDGGIFSPSHRFVNGRCGDAVYPFLTLYHLTGNNRYRKAAIKVFNWSEAHVSQPDGSWVNETDGKNNWKGITCFSVIALGEALRHHGYALTTAESQRWRDRLRRGGDYILSSFTFETGDINYPASASAALAICWAVLGDEKYLARAKDFAAFALQHLTQNNLIWGEGVRGAADTTPKGLRPIDVPYNMEESLPNLALYAGITGDENVRQAAIKSLQSHLKWMLPDGALDAGWCAREYKWNYYGSATTDGPAGGFALLCQYDARFAEAAYRSLRLRQLYTHHGLLYGGRDLYTRNIPVFAHHTISNAKGLAAAIDAGLTASGTLSLPNDSSYGVREWPEANVIQIGVGPWRASVTANDIASSAKRGGHPMGGALTMLWHLQAGPVAVGSMNDYKRYEATNMQPATKEDEACLTPRLEVLVNGKRYSNIYDAKAMMTWDKKGDSVEVKVNGNLRNEAGDVVPGASSLFEIRYTFTPGSFQLSAHAGAAATKFVFPVIAARSEAIKEGAGGTILIQRASAYIKVTSSAKAVGEGMSEKRVFNFVPGFEAVVVENSTDSGGDCFIRLEMDTQVQVTSVNK